MIKVVKIIDTKAGKVAFRRVGEAEAHKRVDGLNAAYGFRRFKVVAPGQAVGLD